ncbi:MAG TPA: hypothetical protein VFZ00_26865 [Solirubrobacter sp.]|jgi:hypothetical protein|nr:hypothetical protein [Solirubrobacter sp.]
MPDPEDELYGLPLEEFTAARDAAAKALRKAGDRETAARIAKLPKPTPAAWAANQVAREQPELIEKLLEAGAELREAQDAAVAGHGSAGLREATLAQRSAVDAVMAAATALKPAGRPLSRAMADRLRTTLQAVAGDEALQRALSRGRLVNEAQAGGAWPFALEPSDEPPPKPAAKKTPARKAKEADAEREQREAAERERREREAREREERKQLEAQLRDARMSLRVRERVAKGAAEDAEAAAQAVADADERLEEAKRAADEARADAEAAQRVFAEAQAELERARDEVARLEERLD